MVSNSRSLCFRRTALAVALVGVLALLGWLALVPFAGGAEAQTGGVGDLIARVLQSLAALFGDLLGPILAFIQELFASGFASP